MEIWQENAIENIRRLISEARTSQGRFAEKANVDPAHFSAIMTNARPVTRQFVAKIAAAVGRQTNWFYESHASETTRTFADAIQLLSAYQGSDPQTQGIALALLSGDLKHVPSSLPAAAYQAVAALLESLKSTR